MINRDDEEHLTAAPADGRTLFTCNTADYYASHQSWLGFERNHAGIIVAPQQQYSVGEELRRILVGVAGSRSSGAAESGRT
jgi:hypothetical protein